MDLKDEERSRAYAIGKMLELFGDAIAEQIFWLCNNMRHNGRYHSERPGWSEEGIAWDVVERCPHGIPTRAIYHNLPHHGEVDDAVPCRACDTRRFEDAHRLFDTLPDTQRAIWIAALRRQVQTRRAEHASAQAEPYGYKEENWTDRLAVMAEFEAWAARIALPVPPPPALTSGIYLHIPRPRVPLRKIRADHLSRAHLICWKGELHTISTIARGNYSLTVGDRTSIVKLRPEQIDTMFGGDGVVWDPEQSVEVAEIRHVISTRPDGTTQSRTAAECEKADWKFPADDVCHVLVLEGGHAFAETIYPDDDYG